MWGLFYKGMFLLTFLSGVVLASQSTRLEGVQQSIRAVCLIAGCAALVAVALFAANPESSTRFDRLSLEGLNPNMLAQTAAPLAILCAYGALYDNKRGYRWFAAISFALLIIVMVMSGSRGGLAMALVGCGILTVPVAKRPGLLLVGMGVVFTSGYFAVELMGGFGSIRLLEELTKDTRSGIWTAGVRRFLDRPLLGHGWFHKGNGWATFQNAYLQVAIETGVLGITVICLGLVEVMRRWWIERGRVGDDKRMMPLVYLSGACIVASALHGVAETTFVLGTALNPFLFGFGIALTDQVSRLSGEVRRRQQRWRRLRAQQRLQGQLPRQPTAEALAPDTCAPPLLRIQAVRDRTK